MHIEVFEGGGSTPASPQWFWHFKNKGRITSNGECHPTKGNAVRAAKACVKSIGKCMTMYIEPVFAAKDSKTGITTITWR
jgi:hypothetical protein